MIIRICPDIYIDNFTSVAYVNKDPELCKKFIGWIEN